MTTAVQKSGSQPVTAQVRQMVDLNMDKITEALPYGVNAKNVVAVAINAINTNPVLLKCTPQSLFLSICKGLMCGLEVSGPLQEGHIVPFKNQATFMPDYKGLIKLAMNSGNVSSIYAEKVCKQDQFAVQQGTDRIIQHQPEVFGDRGETVGYYAVIRFNDGSFDFETMSIEEVDAIKKRSKSSSNGPWVTDYDEMAKKTVIKRLLKRQAKATSRQYAIAAQADNAVSMGEAQTVDIEGFTLPDEPSAQDKTDETLADMQKQLTDIGGEEPKKPAPKRTAKKIPAPKKEDPPLKRTPVPTGFEKKKDEDVIDTTATTPTLWDDIVTVCPDADRTKINAFIVGKGKLKDGQDVSELDTIDESYAARIRENTKEFIDAVNNS